MVERRVCIFCGSEIEPGTGKLYIKTDGTVLNFCSSKCQKNLLKLKRIPRRTRWTEQYRKEKEASRALEESRKGKKKAKSSKKKVASKKATKKIESADTSPTTRAKKAPKKIAKKKAVVPKKKATNSSKTP